MRKQHWRNYLYLTSIIVLILVGARIFEVQLRSQYEASLNHQLEHALTEKYAALTRWSNQIKASAGFFAANFMSISSQQSGSVFISANNQWQLQAWLDQLRGHTAFSDVILLNNKQLFAGNGRQSIFDNRSKLSLPESFFRQIWQGQTALSLPIKCDIPLQDHSGNTKSGLISQFLGVPIFHQNTNQVIATLLLRLDPKNFGEIFETLDSDDHYESFAFDQQLQLLNESRYNDQLRKLGILTDTNSLGSVTVKLPQFEQRSSLSRPQQAATAIEFITTPYVNYRGKRVIGAWRWYPALNLGIALEQDAEHALRTLNDVSNATHAITLILIIVSGVVFMLISVIRKNRREQAYLPSLLEAGTEAIISVDRYGTILYANSRVTELLGYTVDELIDHNVDLLLPETLRELHKQKRLEFMLNPVQRPMGKGLELHALHKNGDVVLIEIGLNPFQSGKFRGITISLRDVSVQQKLLFELSRYRGRLNQLVEKRTAELEANRKELESYSYTIAHDLRAPLRAITGYSQLLLDENELQHASERKDALNRIIQASKRMADMIDDILKLSRITRKDIQYAEVNLSLMVEKSIEQIQQKNPKQKFKFHIEKDLRVRGDQRLLSLVVENLIENACKYTRLKPTSVVQFGMHRHKEVDAFYIRDNGIGFDMAHRHQLFKPFYRLHARELYEGEGIGLATAQRIIHRHGGRIWANSEKNVGSTFYFTIPEVRSAESASMPASGKSATSGVTSAENS